MSDDLKKIKKFYGENMMHLCRELFSTILENNGVLFSLLEENFAYSKFLYDDLVDFNMIDEFKNYIYSKYNNIIDTKTSRNKTPFELLKEAGYDLYECKSEKDIQRFKKYYADKEELCTFRGGRLESCYVFFAVKKNANKLKREDFNNPKREDEYGTSVISIQFYKGENNNVSIKNRYNHTVDNPDATFSNNLDNIIEGLTESFEEYYGFNLENNKYKLSFPDNYVLANDGKYYRFNYEFYNTYFCSNNIIINNGEVIRKFEDKEKFLVIDYFIIDLVNKKFRFDYKINDSFTYDLNNIDKIEILKDKKTLNKDIKLYFNNENLVTITIDKYNRIIKLIDNKSINIKSEYLLFCKYIEEIEMNNVTKIDDDFLNVNNTLKVLKIPNLEEVASGFLRYNNSLGEIYFPKLRNVGDEFLRFNEKISQIDFPLLENIGNFFLTHNKKIINVVLNNVKEIGNGFLQFNPTILYVELNKVEKIGSAFLERGIRIKSINFPNLEKIKANFLTYNTCISEIVLPKLKNVGSGFLFNNELLEQLSLPSLEETGDNFLRNNTLLSSIYVPNLKYAGAKFLYHNVELTEFHAPSLTSVSEDFMFNNYYLEVFDAENLKTVLKNFLYFNNRLINMNTPNLKIIYEGFLSFNKTLTYLYLPEILEISSDFLTLNNSIETIYVPKMYSFWFENPKVLEAITHEKPLRLDRGGKLC